MNHLREEDYKPRKKARIPFMEIRSQISKGYKKKLYSQFMRLHTSTLK